MMSRLYEVLYSVEPKLHPPHLPKAVRGTVWVPHPVLKIEFTKTATSKYFIMEF